MDIGSIVCMVAIGFTLGILFSAIIDSYLTAKIYYYIINYTKIKEGKKNAKE